MATAGGDITEEPGRFVCPYDDLATVAGYDSIGCDSRIASHPDIRGVRDIGITALEVTADEHLTATEHAGNIDARIVGERDTIAQYLNLTTTTQHRGGLDTAAVVGIASAGDEADHPALADDAVGRDDAAVVDHVAEDVAGDLAGHQHLTGIGMDLTAVADRTLQRFKVLGYLFTDLETQQTVAIEIQRRH